MKYFLIDGWKNSGYALDSEYAMVLNILGLRKVMNKIFHQGSIFHCTSYMFGRFLSIPSVLNMLGHEYVRVANMPKFCVNCILKILSILNVMNSEYAKVLNVSGL